jgi:hypothetical protein
MPQGGMGVLFRERIGGRGVTNVRACARPNFYPYRTPSSGTTCNMRAMRLGKPRLPTRPISIDGHDVVTHGRLGRVDL